MSTTQELPETAQASSDAAPKKKRKPYSLALHEAGHAIAAAAYGVLLDKDLGIEMDYYNGNGCVNYDEKSYDRLSVEQKTVLALAGLAAERFFHKECGVVYWTVKVNDNLYRKEVPKEYKGLSNEEGTGDLNTVDELMPSDLKFKWGKDEEWCNRHLKTAWELLHQHEAAFLELYEAIAPANKHKFGEEVNRWDEWVFEPSAVEHILVKVRPTKTRRKKAVKEAA